MLTPWIKAPSAIWWTSHSISASRTIAATEAFHPGREIFNEEFNPLSSQGGLIDKGQTENPHGYWYMDSDTVLSHTNTFSNIIRFRIAIIRPSQNMQLF
jgi:hypothetical protein